MSAVHTLQDATGILERIPAVGTSKMYGPTTPADLSPGYVAGCQFTNSSTGVLYINNGSVTACKFDAVPTGNTTGAGQIGITDAGGYTGTTTVEGAIQEIYQDLTNINSITIDIPLSSVRYLQGDGSFGNTLQNGGTMSNETTPNLSVNGNGAARIGIVASNTNKLLFTFPIPPNADPAGCMTLQYTYKHNGTTNPFGSLNSLSVDGAAATTQVANASAANTALQTSNATFPASGNYTGNSQYATVTLQQATHGTDAWEIYGIRVNFKPENPVA